MRGLGTPLRRVLKRAGLENIRVHDLRRTLGSWLAQSGKSLHLIGDVLNHRDPKTTAGYAYFQTHQRRDALTGHGEHVLSLGAPHLREPAQPQMVSATMVLPVEDMTQVVSTTAQAVRHRHYFKREALYELVWMAPVMEVARRLGGLGRWPCEVVSEGGYSDTTSRVLGSCRSRSTDLRDAIATSAGGLAGAAKNSRGGGDELRRDCENTGC